MEREICNFHTKGENSLIFNEETAVLIKGDLEKNDDERWFFARSWDKQIFEQNGLNCDFVQCNISFNKKKGTLRGMHFQEEPYQEAKLVRCTKGSVYEVMIDLRKDSDSFKQWEAFELHSNEYKMMYIPEGFALGFQTLEDNTELFYQMSQYYKPEFSRGVRWNDDVFKISWPLEISVISKKDQSFSSFK